MSKIKIYIDDDGDFDEFATHLKKKIKLRFKGQFEVLTYDQVDGDMDIEETMIKAISTSDIIMPLLSNDYLGYVTEKVESEFNEIISRKNQYLIPIYYKKSDWSSRDWVVKSKVFPDGEKSFEELNDYEVDEFYSGLYSTLEKIANAITGENIDKQEKPKQIPITDSDFVFISHSHEDADFAELLSLHLEKQGISSWLDSSELKVGQDWREEIDTNIKNALAVIVIMSPDARKSEYVTYEWAFAWGKDIKIFPLMLKQTTLHPRLESLQYLDFTKRITRPWTELVKSIKAIK